MGYHLEFNCLLVVPSQQIDLKNLSVGDKFTVIKEKERLYPLDIAIEICDEDYQYFGKVAVRKLTLESGATTVDIEVLRVFSFDEAAVYTDTFIKPQPK